MNKKNVKNVKNVKRCTGLLLNCALMKGHPGNCSPIHRKKVERTSPCAGKCRHQWCAGYNAGYPDGQDDERDAMERSPALVERSRRSFELSLRKAQ